MSRWWSRGLRLTHTTYARTTTTTTKKTLVAWRRAELDQLGGLRAGTSTMGPQDTHDWGLNTHTTGSMRAKDTNLCAYYYYTTPMAL